MPFCNLITKHLAQYFPKPLHASLNIRTKEQNKISVCETVMFPPPCHIDTGSGTVHKLISKELDGKYRCYLRKE